MKKSFFVTAFSLILISFFASSSFAQTRTNKFQAKRTSPKVLRVKNVNNQPHILLNSTIKLEEGRQRIGRNTRTKSNLFIHVKNGRISGFGVHKSNGRVLNLTTKSTRDIPPGFGCPDGFDWKLVCYTHPVHKVMVCYSLCVANTITLRIPSNW